MIWLLKYSCNAALAQMSFSFQCFTLFWPIMSVIYLTATKSIPSFLQTDAKAKASMSTTSPVNASSAVTKSSPEFTIQPHALLSQPIMDGKFK